MRIQVSMGSDAMSPQIESGTETRRAASMTAFRRRSMAGCNGW